MWESTWLKIVVLEATFVGEELSKASGFFLACAEFTSFGIADQGMLQLVAIPLGCLICWPPLFFSSRIHAGDVDGQRKAHGPWLPWGRRQIEALHRDLNSSLFQSDRCCRNCLHAFCFFADSCCALSGPPWWFRRSGWKALGWDELWHFLKYVFGYCPGSRVGISPKVQFSYLEKWFSLPQSAFCCTARQCENAAFFCVGMFEQTPGGFPDRTTQYGWAFWPLPDCQGHSRWSKFSTCFSNIWSCFCIFAPLKVHFHWRTQLESAEKWKSVRVTSFQEWLVERMTGIMYQQRLLLTSYLLMVLYTEISELFCTSFRLAFGQ